MNIIDIVRRTVGNMINRKSGIKNLFLSSWQYGRNLLPEDDKQKQLQAYKSWIYVFSNKNAISVSQIPLHLYVAKPEKGSKSLFRTKKLEPNQRKYLYDNAGLDNYLRKAVEVEEILEHPLLDLLKNVNPFMNQFELKEMTTLQQELCGNSYWYIVNNSMGLPAEIWFVPPDKMKIIPDKKEYISGYVFRNSTEEIYYKPEEIIHFKYSDPKNNYYGLSPLMALARTYNLVINMEDYQKNLLENQGIPSGLLTTEASLTPEQAQELSERWNQKYMGTKKAGKTAILGGGLKYTPITISPKDMGVLASDKYAKEKLCNAFGQSLGMYSENATEANSKTAYMSYMRDAVRPRLRRQEQKMNEQLCPRYDDRIFVAYDNPVPEDREYLLKKRDSDLKNFVISPNEAREQDGKEPAEWGEVPLVPFNLMPYSPTKTTSPKSDGGEKTVKKKEIDKEQYWNTFIKKVTPFERKFTENVRQLFIEQEEKAKSALRKKTARKAVAKDVDDVLNIPKTEAELRKWTEFFLPAITETVKYNGKQALYELGLEISFDINNPKVVEWIKSHTGEAIKQIQDTTLEKLRTTLAEGVANGESIPDLSKRVAEAYEEAKGYRTDRIARTETINASNKGTLEGYKQSGVVEKKEWITAVDERSCEECVAMDGEIVEINKAFSCGVMQPPLHPNCRCCIAAVV